MDPRRRSRNLVIRTAFLCLFLSIVSAPATADETADIRGSWTFRANTGGNCAFGGKAVIFSPVNPNAENFECELTARHYCPWSFDFIVQQTCTVEREANEIRIRSTIVEFLNNAPTASYVPDDFDLTVKSRDTMIGVLATKYGNYPAKWTREEGSTS